MYWQQRNGFLTSCVAYSCRKVSGGPFQAWADVDASSVTFFDHKEALQYGGLPKNNMGGIIFIRLSDLGERAYCATCNTPLAMRYKNWMENTSLALGAVDEESLTKTAKEALQLSAHIFTSHKAWWLNIKDDDLPKYDRFTDESFEDMTLQDDPESFDGEEEAWTE
ncbi:hypothetical protein CERZMDRAFT_81501 [Cercospora zeae-maydis SCOH1-5]|uniref:CENP-V/GFA domain-containing protein n=1 Tax=Cercospora zeae-maydis SCOH1-5 TaxID=717836 RepID=A0A6A6FSU4_9PEZI|nr:hypothetical protein CERZMDRAFT_81501 [Cercospora zeae-maydis SCOH1-5]